MSVPPTAVMTTASTRLLRPHLWRPPCRGPQTSTATAATARSTLCSTAPTVRASHGAITLAIALGTRIRAIIEPAIRAIIEVHVQDLSHSRLWILTMVDGRPTRLSSLDQRQDPRTLVHQRAPGLTDRSPREIGSARQLVPQPEYATPVRDLLRPAREDPLSQGRPSQEPGQAPGLRRP